MKYCIRLAVPVVALAVLLTVVLAQPKDPYKFELGADITSKAGNVVIEPKLKALSDDTFGYEVYTKTRRFGLTEESGKTYDGFTQTENWTNLVTVTFREDPIEGNKDLLAGVQFDSLLFVINNGESKYSGYVGPQSEGRQPEFQEIYQDGTTKVVNNIPGWAGITARTVESGRQLQSRIDSASVTYSVDENGRAYNDTWVADFGQPDQRNYPARLQDPSRIGLMLIPQFNEGTKVKIGESVVVRRRLPVGSGKGATSEYDVTYKLERLYGTVEEPTAARFSWTAKPVNKMIETTDNGLKVRYNAPEITDGSLLVDLKKGVAADVSYTSKVRDGVISSGNYRTVFEWDYEFTASLREPPETEETEN